MTGLHIVSVWKKTYPLLLDYCVSLIHFLEKWTRPRPWLRALEQTSLEQVYSGSSFCIDIFPLFLWLFQENSGSTASV